MYIITDFSLEKYIEAAGETLDDLTESFKQKLYNDLGISSYLRDDQCNISSEDFTPHYQGWKSGLLHQCHIYKRIICLYFVF